MKGTTADLPTGTATFLFTDIEGSTRMVQALGIERWREVLEAHYTVLRGEFDAHGGQEVNTEGDAFFEVFPQAREAVAACAAGQRALAAYPWPEDAPVRVRMGLHTGEAAMVGDDYMGLDIHRAARIASSAHGGQVVLSETTRALVASALPPGVGLKDLGEHKLKDLTQPEHIFQLLIDGLPNDFQALKTLDATPNNLPVQPTPFIGRARDVERVLELLAGRHLVTLTGPGGTGKTRLALQAAAEAADRYRDGVYFVPLAPISDPALVPSAILQALGVHDIGARPPGEALVEHLRDRSVLIVLDNFEQILPAAAVVGEILREAPRATLVVTSRAVLRVYGEQEFPVPPMAVPDAVEESSMEALLESESVKLFVERALAVKPDFAADETKLRAAAEIAALLDGLPLAIELAAAQVRLFAPPAILERLQKRMTGLGGGARDLPARQQTLRDAIGWSYDLLSDDVKVLFATFAVFAGGAELAQVEAVCAPDGEFDRDVVEMLGALVEQSLLRQVEANGQPRFSMLHVIREYALDRLTDTGDGTEIRRRHAGAFLAFAQEHNPRLTGPDRKQSLDRMQQEHDNLRAALGWAVAENDGGLAAQLLASQWRFWQMRGHLLEGRARADEVLAMPALSGVPRDHYAALEAAGSIAHWQGDVESAAALYTQALDLAREIGDRVLIAGALYDAVFPNLVAGRNIPEAEALAEQAAEAYRELGDDVGMARALWARANMYFRHEPPDYQAAITILEEVCDVFRRAGDRFSLGWALYNLGLDNVGLGRTHTGEEALRESMGIFSEVGDLSGIVLLLDAMATLAVAMENYGRAARLAGASSAMEQKSGVGLASARRVIVREFEAGSRRLKSDFAEDYAAGEAMPVEDAVDLALGRVKVSP